MNFTSPEFILFFPIVLALFYVIPVRSRWILLLAASWVFYLSWNPWTGILLILATGCSYAAGIRIEDARRKTGIGAVGGSGVSEVGAVGGSGVSGVGAAGSSGMSDVGAEGGSLWAVNFWSFVGIGVPLACLLIFKYAGFFANTTSSLLTGLGFRTNISLPRFVLPIGISFYTFQTLSYVIDVRRGTIPAERHFGFYALFVSFFPQLVAGPIERPGSLIPQLRRVCGMEDAAERLGVQNSGDNSNSVRSDMASEAALDTASANRCSDGSKPVSSDMTLGLQRILIGFFKKLAVADYLATFVEPVYANPAGSTSVAVVLATVLFALQIYCDFSGYSDIACGAARMMGIRLTENFRLPYLAGSVREFWRRWHISLSAWLTDYIYIPLGGNRRGVGRQMANIMIVFLVSGLWHGANMTFVVWGILHGAAICVETLAGTRGGKRSPRELSGTQGGRKSMGEFADTQGGQKSLERLVGTRGGQKRPETLVRRLVTFAYICFTWIFFRAGSLQEARELIGRLFSAPGAGAFEKTASLMGLTGLSLIHVVLALGCLWLLERRREETEAACGLFGEIGQATFVIIMVMTVAASWLMLLANNAGNVFIYFRF